MPRGAYQFDPGLILLSRLLVHLLQPCSSPPQTESDGSNTNQLFTSAAVLPRTALRASH